MSKDTINSLDIEIITKNEQLWTTSLDIALKFGKIHRNVMRAIKKFEKKHDFYVLNFEHATRMIKGHKSQEYFLVSRKGFSILAMGFTGDEALDWKIKFYDAFENMEQTLIRISYAKARQAEIEWQHTRLEGKVTRRRETDTIKDFVEYARNQGSNHPEKYYMNFTKMENKHLFFLEKNIKMDNIRNYLSVKQLGHLNEADHIVERAIRQGMKEGLFYRDVFKLAKNNVITFVSISGKTMVPIYRNNELILTN